MSTILIVANQTLPSKGLATEVDRRIATASGEIADRDPVAAGRDAPIPRQGCETSTVVESNGSCVNPIQLADSVGPIASD